MTGQVAFNDRTAILVALLNFSCQLINDEWAGFHNEPTSRNQIGRRSSEDVQGAIATIFAAEQRNVWFEVNDFTTQQRLFTRPDVGWVGDNDMEAVV